MIVASSALIEDCIFDSHYSRGLSISGGGPPFTRDHDSGKGLVQIRRCVFRNFLEFGLDLRSAAALSISDSLFEDIGSFGPDAADRMSLETEGKAYWIVGRGLSLVESSWVELRCCRFRRCLSSAVYCASGSRAAILDSIVEEVFERGLIFCEGSKALISSSSISSTNLLAQNNWGGAVAIHGGSQLTLHNCKLNGGAANGLSIEMIRDPKLEDQIKIIACKLEGYRGYGLAILNELNADLERDREACKLVQQQFSKARFEVCDSDVEQNALGPILARVGIITIDSEMKWTHKFPREPWIEFSFAPISRDITPPFTGLR